MNDKDFFIDLEKFNQETVSKIRKAHTELSLSFVEFTAYTDVSDEFINKYEIEGISFYLNFNRGDLSAKYYYDGLEIKPYSYFFLPKNCRKVETLTMLHEAIKQRTYRPNIKHLQNPEGETDND